MPHVAGIRFKNAGKIYTFDTDGLEVKQGDTVIVESDFGLTIGKVIKGTHFIEQEERPLKKIIRIATEEDFKTLEQNKTLEKEAYDFCLERIKARGMVMKLVTTEATLDRKRIIFYFTADGRVDFRELVKDLAARFKTRIEMRQIGVRDESKMVGGIGICGREFCCSTFLTNFDPVAIKMAKDQSLVLNVAKLSGVCGRLMCCLRYEFEGDLKEIVAEDEIPTLDEDTTISQDDTTMADILSKIDEEDSETIPEKPSTVLTQNEVITELDTTENNKEETIQQDEDKSFNKKDKPHFDRKHHKKRRYFKR
ncbi:MAG: stage 0 sporulation family protein [Thermodesulfovibrionales bacterium]|nr:stage 0 sporulation family protein [Thermodesulfovibrionales bacterium]